MKEDKSDAVYRVCDLIGIEFFDPLGKLTASELRNLASLIREANAAQFAEDQTKGTKP